MEYFNGTLFVSILADIQKIRCQQSPYNKVRCSDVQEKLAKEIKSSFWSLSPLSMLGCVARTQMLTNTSYVFPHFIAVEWGHMTSSTQWAVNGWDTHHFQAEA